MKSEVIEYFKNSNNLKELNSKIWFNYGRMRANWEKIDVAEKYLEENKKRKETNYRFIKENEMKSKLEEYNQKTWTKNNSFDVMNFWNRELWRTLEIWIMDWNKDNWDIRWKQSIEIEERRNPEYFKELLKRFKLV